jgi:hypothetical protein
MIDKLAVEFASELEGLNVRVTNVESRIDNVKWGGEFRERYDHAYQDSVGTSNTSGSHSYVDMWATAQINPDWVGKAEYETTEAGTNGGGNSAGHQSISDTRVYAEGTLFGGKATIGKFDPFVGYGLVIDDSMTGAQFQFGNELKARVAYGKYTGGIDNNNSDSAAVTFANAPTYGYGELDFATSKVTNIKVAYHELDNLNSSGAAGATGIVANLPNSIHYTEAGFDTKLGKDLALMATYSKANADLTAADGTVQDNKGYFTQLTYKAADTKVVGSYDLFVNYRKVPVLSQLDSTWDYVRGMKGTEVGFEYVPALNTKVTAFYLAGKDINDANGNTLTTDPNDKVYRTQVEFFF